MSDLAILQQQLAALRDDEAKRRADERSARAREMQDLEPLRSRFERVVGGWLSDIVLPRLKALAETLPHAERIAPVRAAFHARVEFGWTEQFPVSASLTVSIMPDARYERARVRIEPLLIPMLEGHPAAANWECDLDADAPRSLAQFLDREIVAFARSYLHVRDPDSPYLRHKWVRDPVCGMTFHPSDAVETWMHEGVRYHFCTSSCAARFRQDPEHYLEAWRPYLSGAL